MVGAAQKDGGGGGGGGGKGGGVFIHKLVRLRSLKKIKISKVLHSCILGF